MKTDLAVELLQVALDTVLGRRHFDEWLWKLGEVELRIEVTLSVEVCGMRKDAILFEQKDLWEEQKKGQS